MVKIHICKECNEEIYYKPEFVSANGFLGNGHGTGYTTSFRKMNLDKTSHDCSEFVEEGKRWAEYEEQIDRAEKTSREAYDNWREWAEEMWERT